MSLLRRAPVAILASVFALSIITSSLTTSTAQAAPRVNCAVKKCVALTFDDGPGPYTNRLVNTLKANGVRATFFMQGANVARRPDVVRRVHRAGMVIGNHSWSHPQFTRISAARQRSELARTSAAIQKAGAPAPKLFRPPYGSYSATTRSLGMPIVLWNVDPQDWRNRNARVVADRVVSQTRPGSIVLLHDVHRTSVDAVPTIISRLKAPDLTSTGFSVWKPIVTGSADGPSGRRPPMKAGSQVIPPWES